MKILLIIYTLLISLYATDFDTALKAYQQKEYATAVSLFKKSAAKDDVKSQLTLAYMYDKASGVKKDHTQAVKWYEKACEQNDSMSCYNLAIIYHTSDTIKHNYNKSIKLYEKSAKLGYNNAFYNLGQIYLEDKIQNYEKATYWLKKAKIREIKDATVTLDRLCIKYSPACGPKQVVKSAINDFKKKQQVKTAFIGDIRDINSSQDSVLSNILDASFKRFGSDLKTYTKVETIREKLKLAQELLDNAQYVESEKILKSIILANRDEKHKDLRKIVAMTYSQYILILYETQRYNELISEANFVLNYYKDDEKINTKIAFVNILFYKASTFNILEKYNKSLVVYTSTIDKYADDVIMDSLISVMMYNRALILLNIKKFQESKQAFRLQIAKYKESTDEEIQQDVSSSIVNLSELELITMNHIKKETKVLQHNYILNSDKIKIDMLNILNDSFLQEQEVVLNRWSELYHDKKITNYTFADLEQWAAETKDKNTRERITKYLKKFMELS